MKEQDERIERLLECYFDARTTEAEERELRDYFRYVDEIPASLRYGADDVRRIGCSGRRAVSRRGQRANRSGCPSGGKDAAL